MSIQVQKTAVLLEDRTQDMSAAKLRELYVLRRAAPSRADAVNGYDAEEVQAFIATQEKIPVYDNPELTGDPETQPILSNTRGEFRYWHESGEQVDYYEPKAAGRKITQSGVEIPFIDMREFVADLTLTKDLSPALDAFQDSFAAGVAVLPALKILGYDEEGDPIFDEWNIDGVHQLDGTRGLRGHGIYSSRIRITNDAAQLVFGHEEDPSRGAETGHFHVLGMGVDDAAHPDPLVRFVGSAQREFRQIAVEGNNGPLAEAWRIQNSRFISMHFNGGRDFNFRITNGSANCTMEDYEISNYGGIGLLVEETLPTVYDTDPDPIVPGTSILITPFGDLRAWRFMKGRVESPGAQASERGECEAATVIRNGYDWTFYDHVSKGADENSPLDTPVFQIERNPLGEDYGSSPRAIYFNGACRLAGHVTTSVGLHIATGPVETQRLDVESMESRDESVYVDGTLVIRAHRKQAIINTDEDVMIVGSGRIESSASAQGWKNQAGANLTKRDHVFPPEGCRVRRTSNQTHTSSGNWVPISFEEAVWQHGGEWWAIGTPTKVIILKSGYYEFESTIQFAANATGQRGARVLVNGGQIAGGGILVDAASAGVTQLPVTPPAYYCEKDDEITLEGFQSSTGNLVMTSSTGALLNLSVINRGATGTLDDSLE